MAEEKPTSSPSKGRLKIGDVFGRLTVVAVTPGDRYVNCVCNCGKSENSIRIFESSLKQRKTRSCGCLGSEMRRARKFKHGAVDPYLYSLWFSIKGRCQCINNPAYKDYGGRGIDLYEPWTKDYLAFRYFILTTIGHRPTATHSLDRIDNNRGYEPGNLKWSTKTEQARNRRNSVYLEYQGETKHLIEWCELYNRKPAAAFVQLRRGESTDKIFGFYRRAKIRIEWKGETKFLYDWCKDLSIDYQAALGRYKRGSSVERILLFDLNRKRPVRRKRAE